MTCLSPAGVLVSAFSVSRPPALISGCDIKDALIGKGSVIRVNDPLSSPYALVLAQGFGAE